MILVHFFNPLPLKEEIIISLVHIYFKHFVCRYVDRIAESLLQKLQISEKLINQVATLKKKSKEAVELQIETQPKLEILVKRTKTLQTQVLL